MTTQETVPPAFKFNGNVGFLGFGFMGQSLARGFISKNVVFPSQIVYHDPSSDTVREDPSFKDCNVAKSNLDVVERCEFIIIAVKPQVVLDILKSLRYNLHKDPLFVSICAGVTLKQLERSLQSGSRVIRVMPNTAVSVGMGATVVSGGTRATDEDCDLVCRLFESVGMCIKLPESQLNVVTAISGSGPAYAYIGIDAAGDAGAMLGLPKHISQQLAAHTMMGAAKMFLESGKHAGSLKDAVCSPGGTTLAGVRCLEKGAFRSVIMETIAAAHDRAQQLEKAAADDL